MKKRLAIFNHFKSSISFILSVGVVTLVMTGCRESGEETKREGTRLAGAQTNASLSHTPSGETFVSLDAATQARAKLVIAPAAAATWLPEIKAYGKVLDPTPLITLHGDLLALEVALTNSALQFQRTQTLFQEGQNASRRALDAAQAEFRSHEVRAQVATSRLKLEWGEGIAALDTGGRAKLVETLLNRKAVLLRVDSPIGEPKLPELPATARAAVAGYEENIFKASVVSLAPVANEKVPGQGFLLRVDNPEASLRPGAPVAAFLRLPGEAQIGVILPPDALLRHLGHTWVYVQLDANRFTRRHVTLLHSIGAGWFVKEDIHPGVKLVVEGAQALLSEELKSELHVSE